MADAIRLLGALALIVVFVSGVSISANTNHGSDPRSRRALWIAGAAFGGLMILGLHATLFP